MVKKVVNCLNCGKEFTTTESELKRNRGKFCNRKCVSGKFASNYKDGRYINIGKNEYLKKYGKETREKYRPYHKEYKRKYRFKPEVKEYDRKYAEKHNKTEEHKQSYEKHRPKKNIKSTDRRKEQKMITIPHYSKGTMKCELHKQFWGNEFTDFDLLTIDHVNGGGTKHRKEIKGGNIHHWLIKNGLPEGYRVLCWNCNRKVYLDKLKEKKRG